MKVGPNVVKVGPKSVNAGFGVKGLELGERNYYLHAVAKTTKSLSFR